MARGVLVGAAGLAVLAVLAVPVLVTDVGAPEDPFTSTPQPCELIGDEMVADLVGSVSGRVSEPSGGPGWRPLHRGTHRLQCEWENPDEPLARRLQVEVERHHSTQFGLGPTGSQRAEVSYESDRGRAHCRDELPLDRGRACARTTPAAVTVLRDNVVVRVSLIRTGGSPNDPWAADEIAPALAEEVLSRLERA